MEQLTIQLPSHSYEVIIAKDAIDTFIEQNESALQSYDRIAIIADETVFSLYKEKLQQLFQKYSLDVVSYVVPKGEACKTFSVYGDVQSFLLKQRLTRDSLLIAFGGGAVGDLTGFVAATYMRGISFIQWPTTILAHDSAVGGKTAINLPEGKNMVGAFHQPEAVIFDTRLFDTLPQREWRSGMAELLKHAYISDAAWTEELLNDPSFVRPDMHLLPQRLIRGVDVKARIVEEDTFERGTRKFLNFGHTFGHAVEAATGFGTMSHGECIMVGMGYALLMSEKYGEITREETVDFLQFSLKQGYRYEPIFEHSFDTFYQYMKNDKKASYGEIHFVVLRKIGEPFVTKITEDESEEVFNTLRQLIKGMSV